jgi:pyridoxamine 5'-phosphate oxidase
MDIFKRYGLVKLDESEVDPNPFEQFDVWYKVALKSKIKEPTTMILATATAGGIPSARAVLLKRHDHTGFVFFTNYESRKGQEIAQNPRAALLFLWTNLSRQIRIEGIVEKTTESESEEYFSSRPFRSRIAAWASQQSHTIINRKYLKDRFKTFLKKYKSEKVPLPPFWGGYQLKPERFEFWQGRFDRLHDRVRYTKKDDGWKIERLAP